MVVTPWLTNSPGLWFAGLFRSARPTAKQPTPASCAPAFVVPSGQGRRLQVVAPLGAIEFVVTPRMLPALQELTVQAEGVDVDPGQLQQVRAEALAAGTAGTPALACLLQARRSLLQAVPEGERAQTEVVFSGAEQGKVQATVRTVPAGQPCSVSGLEGSAPGGQGWGIDSFKRQAKQAVNAGSGGLRIELGLPPSQQQQEQQEQQPGVAQLRPWTREELDMAEASSTSSAPGSNLLAGFLTQTYGSFQAKAGKTVGIWPGAAWRTALQAAAVAGTVQVHLGDRPATTTSERLAAGIWAGSSLQLLGSIPASVASAIIVWQGMEPGGAGSAAAVAAAALLPLLAGAWPVLGPLLEIAQFSGKDAATIEDLVRVKEKLQVRVGAQQVCGWGDRAGMDGESGSAYVFGCGLLGLLLLTAKRALHMCRSRWRARLCTNCGERTRCWAGRGQWTLSSMSAMLIWPRHCWRRRLGVRRA